MITRNHLKDSDSSNVIKWKLYDIINEEIVNFKKGKLNEELNESDKDLIRKIIVSAEIFFDLFKKRKTWGKQ